MGRSALNVSPVQAQESKDKRVVANMYLPLAERLIEKYVQEKKVDGEAGGSWITGEGGGGGGGGGLMC